MCYFIVISVILHSKRHLFLKMVGNKVIKGRKYILAGNFPTEHKQTFIDSITKELGIEIVAVTTSDNTHFIEYVDEDSELNNLKSKKDYEIRMLEIENRDLKQRLVLKQSKRGWFR